ncbi:MAG: hypothetical protein WEB60_09270 [Terrimicrobiaceae bacterium]
MKGTYVDSGVFVKSDIEEPNSTEADKILCTIGTPVAFSRFHEIEIPNAIRLKGQHPKHALS